MIDDRDRIYSSLGAFQWNPTEESYEDKVDALDAAVALSVQDIALRAIVGRVHMSLSGGVDSTLLLFLLASKGVPVTAHTLASNDEHPDLVHARLAVASAPGDVRHQVHLIDSTPEDIQESDETLGKTGSMRPDNYFLLMRAVARHTGKLVSGDVIDELLGGYYTHRGPNEGSFRRHLDLLIPNHMEPLDQCSTALGVAAFLPYASENVMDCCSAFRFNELVDDTQRKRPMYEMARRIGVPPEILRRRKYGLVSALDK